MFNVAKIRTAEVILAEHNTEAFKASRIAMLNASVVEVHTGKKFDANEEAQKRMSNAILALSVAGRTDADTLHWSLADTPSGVATEITVGELKEAFVLAVENMAAIWLR